MESTSLTPAPTLTTAVTTDQQRTGLYDLKPRALVAAAAEMAEVLAEVIEKQKLYELVNGKRFVRLEGWLVLGTLVGVSSREVSCEEQDDGSVIAKVELYNVRTGAVIGGASALCGVEEKRWAKAERYARRSMAITRATSKAYRNNFSWVAALAGFEATPAEEMTGVVIDSPKPVTKAPAKPAGFDPNNKAHIDAMAKALAAKQVPEDLWDQIGNAMRGKSMTELDAVIGGLA